MIIPDGVDEKRIILVKAVQIWPKKIQDVNKTKPEVQSPLENISLDPGLLSVAHFIVNVGEV